MRIESERSQAGVKECTITFATKITAGCGRRALRQTELMCVARRFKSVDVVRRLVNLRPSVFDPVLRPKDATDHGDAGAVALVHTARTAVLGRRERSYRLARTKTTHAPHESKKKHIR